MHSWSVDDSEMFEKAGSPSGGSPVLMHAINSAYHHHHAIPIQISMSDVPIRRLALNGFLALCILPCLLGITTRILNAIWLVVSDSMLSFAILSSALSSVVGGKR